nr:TetR/AcrR family transcriptional regulator [Nocardia wallacei]
MVRATDPRVIRSRERILTSTAELVTEKGIAGVSVAEIATRSGVAKTTLYRQWATLPELMIDAVEFALPPTPEVEPTGDPRDDLVTYLLALADTTGNHGAALIASLAVAARADPVFQRIHHQFVRKRRAPLRVLLERAGVHDTESAFPVLGGTVMYRLLIDPQPTTRGFIEALVDRVLT